MIRPATSADVPAIAAIMNQVIAETTITVTSILKSHADVGAMINDRRALGHDTFVADQNGVVGYASYAQFRPSPGYVRTMEHSLALMASAHGQGFARALMQAVETHAAAAGAHVMVAAITGENTGSIAFHARLGYAHAGLMPQVGYKFGRYHDLVLMQKILT
jgi:L-amino acid N-acyltransferase YncA